MGRRGSQSEAAVARTVIRVAFEILDRAIDEIETPDGADSSSVDPFQLARQRRIDAAETRAASARSDAIRLSTRIRPDGEITGRASVECERTGRSLRMHGVDVSGSVYLTPRPDDRIAVLQGAIDDLYGTEAEWTDAHRARLADLVDRRDRMLGLVPDGEMGSRSVRLGATREDSHTGIVARTGSQARTVTPFRIRERRAAEVGYYRGERTLLSMGRDETIALLESARSDLRTARAIGDLESGRIAWAACKRISDDLKRIEAEIAGCTVPRSHKPAARSEVGRNLGQGVTSHAHDSIVCDRTREALRSGIFDGSISGHVEPLAQVSIAPIAPKGELFRLMRNGLIMVQIDDGHCVAMGRGLVRVDPTVRLDPDPI